MRKRHSISKSVISFAIILTMLFSFAAVSLAAPGDTATNIKGYVVMIDGKNVYFAKEDLANADAIGADSELLKAYNRKEGQTIAFVFDNDLYVDMPTVADAYALGTPVAEVYAINKSPFTTDTPIYKIDPVTGVVPPEPNVKVGASGVEVPPDPENPEIKVMEINPLTPGSILVTFSEDVDNTYTNAANYTLSKGTVVSAARYSDSAVLLTVTGLSSGEIFTLTVVSLGWSGESQIKTVEQKFAVTITTSSETIDADGTSNMTVSAEIINLETGAPVTEDCQIQFIATAGQFAQSIVSMQYGKATTTLKSDFFASDPVPCEITAKVYSFNSNSELIGLSGNKTVHFIPVIVGPETPIITTVNAELAGANQADRFFVTFSDNIWVTPANRNAIMNSVRYVPYNPNNPTLRAEQRVAIKDVFNLAGAGNILVFVLDTDRHNDWTGAVRNDAVTRFDTTILDAEYAAATIFDLNANYFRDNVTHGISFVRTEINGGSQIILASTTLSKLDFILTDTTTPWLKGTITCKTEENLTQYMDDDGYLRNWNQQNLKFAFNESMARDLVQGTITRGGYQINEHFAIDGKHLLIADVGVYREDYLPRTLISDAAYTTEYNKAYNAFYPAAALYAAANNYIIVDYLHVGEYIGADNVPSETREVVYITIAADNALETGYHGIQIANVGDWAGLTDRVQNTITTQTLRFPAEKYPDPEVIRDPFIVWAAFDAAEVNANRNTVGEFDYLYVRFSEVMQAEGADHGVDRTTNYTFNGNELPKGSQVIRGIEGFTDGWDGVTIRMPAGTWTGKAGTLDFDYACVMGVSSLFRSTDGRMLVSPTLPRSVYEFELSDWSGEAEDDKDGIINENDYEAVYNSTNIPGSTVTVGPGSVPGATAASASITGLTAGVTYVVRGESGEYFPVSSNGALDIANHSDTLAGASAFAKPLTDTKIIGLLNGYTYYVYYAQVSNVDVTGVSLNKTAVADMVVGETTTLTATVSPANATDKSVTWSSSDATVAAVDNNGVVTALKAGKATITVITVNGSKAASCVVTVINQADKVDYDVRIDENAPAGFRQVLVYVSIVGVEDATDAASWEVWYNGVTQLTWSNPAKAFRCQVAQGLDEETIKTRITFPVKP